MNTRKNILGLVFLISAGWLQAKPVITSVTLDATTVTLLFDDDGSSNQFELQTNPGLNPANWSDAPSAVQTNLGGGKYRYTIARTAATRQFFRIIGSFLGTGVDRDGDGLPNDLETTLGTHPDRFDTDGDGFSDGVEYSLGTDPKLASSFPERANLPAVEFAASNTLFTEGDAPVIRIQLICSAAFQGAVPYQVSAASTMQAPVDFAPLSGVVSFNGTTANLDITVTDDFLIKPSRFLLLELALPSISAGYRLGGRSAHFCHVTDDDGYWNGALQDPLMVRDFRMRVLRKAGQPTQIAFVSGASDGRVGIDNGTSSQSNGIIPQAPQSVWEASAVTDTPTRFTANSLLLPVTVSPQAAFNGTTSALTSEPMTRRLLFTADQSLAPSQQVGRNLIIGVFTEEIRAEDTTKTFLNRTRTGAVAMMREIPPPAQYTPPTVPN